MLGIILNLNINKMDKLIEQAIGEAGIVRYHQYFEQVCKIYKRLLIENKQLDVEPTPGALKADDCRHPYKEVYQRSDGEWICGICQKIV